jgi:hypothetical protein
MMGWAAKLTTEIDMEQLILHMFGDYITQTDWMANKKTKHTLIAVLHAAIYSVPFLLLSPSLNALIMIFATHAVIDRYRLARFVVFAKNLATQPTLKWSDCNATGYPKETPPWLAVWLLIVADNTMHLMINYAALRWL